MRGSRQGAYFTPLDFALEYSAACRRGYALRVSLRQVATYDRVVGASLERAWENVRDWEHLPHLHSSSFRSIDLMDRGSFGWRARIGLHPSPNEIVLELVIDASGDRYVSRTLEGPGAGSEIWTTLSPADSAQGATQVAVEFHVPGLETVSDAQAEAVGSAYRTLYTKLWDEDEGMMRWRTQALDARRGRPERIELGSIDALHAKLPLDIEQDGRRVRVVLKNGELLAQSTVCPHWLGPLAPEGEGLSCPWHGYRFGADGRSCDGRALSIEAPPRIDIYIAIDSDTDAANRCVALVWGDPAA